MTTIAYPHGKTNERVARAARAAGFQTGYTTREVPVTPDSNPLLLGRYEAPPDSVDEFALGVVRTLAA
jgi:peptidoglycan/xylan/chitin deacetylase (PgdA/CDA1 family)